MVPFYWLLCLGLLKCEVDRAFSNPESESTMQLKDCLQEESCILFLGSVKQQRLKLFP